MQSHPPFSGHSYQPTKQDWVCHVIREFLQQESQKLKAYNVHEDMHRDRIIPFTFLSRRLLNIAVFRKDSLGTTKALHQTISDLINLKILYQVDPRYILERYGYNGVSFCVQDHSHIDRVPDLGIRGWFYNAGIPPIPPQPYEVTFF